MTTWVVDAGVEVKWALPGQVGETHHVQTSKPWLSCKTFGREIVRCFNLLIGWLKLQPY